MRPPPFAGCRSAPPTLRPRPTTMATATTSARIAAGTDLMTSEGDTAVVRLRPRPLHRRERANVGAMTNDEMAEYWNATGGPYWVRERDRYDSMLEPCGQPVLGVAPLKTHLRV